MTKATKILFINQEITPYLPETELSVIGRQLPQGIQELGREIRTFMPKYGNINERRNQLHEVIRLSGMNLIIDETDHPLIIKVASIQAARMQVYFIDNEDYFQRKCVLQSDEGVECEDNDERLIFYVRGVMETVKKLRWAPDIVHCNGWLTALAPVYVKKAFAEDPSFRNSKVVYSLYDNGFKNQFPNNFAEKVLIDGMQASDLEALKNGTDYNALTKLAIDYSDGIIQGSENVSQELIDYAKQQGKPFLPYQSADEYINAYNTFYDEVWEKSNNQ